MNKSLRMAISACNVVTLLLYTTAVAVVQAQDLVTLSQPVRFSNGDTKIMRHRQLAQQGESCAVYAVQDLVTLFKATVGQTGLWDHIAGTTLGPDICSQDVPGIPRNWRPAGKVLALTFDDGPHASSLNAILDVLKAQGVPAAFFVSTSPSWGQAFDSEPNQAALTRLLAEGHELGSHAAEHVYLSKLSTAAAQQQILWAIANITAVTGKETVPLFRAPFGDGFVTYPRGVPATLRQLWATVRQHHVHIAWQFAGGDHALGGTDPGCSDRLFKAYGQQLVTQRVAGAVLMHATPNGMGGCPQALARLIQFWRDAGYQFVTVSQLVEQMYGMSPAAVVQKSRACSSR